MSFALQGVPVDPSDVDVQTDEPGARAIQAAFPDRVVDPVEYVESERIRSYLGRLEVAAVDVEIIGALRKRREDGPGSYPSTSPATGGS